jgi:hypothetical protein
MDKCVKQRREHLHLSLRQVQELSRGIAEQRKNHEYYVVHSSLADIESGKLSQAPANEQNLQR